MITALVSNLQVRLSATTNTQGLPSHRLSILPSQRPSTHIPCLQSSSPEVIMKSQLALQSDGEFAAFIGIDWADTKHDICLQAADGVHREFAVLPHRPADIDDWVVTLRHRFHGRPVAICIETSLAHWPMHCKSTISWSCSRSIRPHSPNTGKPSSPAAPSQTQRMHRSPWRFS